MQGFDPTAAVCSFPHSRQSEANIRASMFVYVNQSALTPVMALSSCSLLTTTGKPEATDNA